MLGHQNVTDDAESPLGAKVAKSLGESLRCAQDRLQFEAVRIKNVGAAVVVGREVVKMIFTAIMDLA